MSARTWHRSIVELPEADFRRWMRRVCFEREQLAATSHLPDSGGGWVPGPAPDPSSATECRPAAFSGRFTIRYSWSTVDDSALPVVRKEAGS